MIELAVLGAVGRMGQRLVALAAHDARFKVVAALEAPGDQRLGVDAGELAGLGRIGVALRDRLDVDFDVLVDFSRPAGTMAMLDECVRRGKAMVIGTTGHTPEQTAAIQAAARRIPLLKASNMSIAVNLLFRLAGEVAAALGDEYDVEIVETHHRFKADAPSGTALTLAEAIAKATGRGASDCVYGRHGQTGTRPPRQIGIHSVRLGDTVGEHEVHFASLGETLTLKHVAHTRDTFAAGALRAAAWLAGKPPGPYSMQDVLR